MKDVHAHIRERLDFIERVGASERYTIVPKKFVVKEVSQDGRGYLPFKEGEKRVFDGRLITNRQGLAGRVFFLPYSVRDYDGTERFIEIKGYGADGREMCLWTHCDRDILFGMFYKNAKKEYDILKKAREARLAVPVPLFVGQILREEWLRSGLRVADDLSGVYGAWDIERFSKDQRKLRREITRRMRNKRHNILDLLSAFSQPDEAGVLGRAVISPLRMGDPSDKYELTEENTGIARQCGENFFRLIGLGFLHTCPGTGNWTEAGELTDMADCYDLQNDAHLEGMISSKEHETGMDFWESLVDPYHTANLSPFFIEGMFGERISIREAGQELKEKTLYLSPYQS